MARTLYEQQWRTKNWRWNSEIQVWTNECRSDWGAGTLRCRDRTGREAELWSSVIWTAEVWSSAIWGEASGPSEVPRQSDDDRAMSWSELRTDNVVACRDLQQRRSALLSDDKRQRSCRTEWRAELCGSANWWWVGRDLKGPDRTNAQQDGGNDRREREPECAVCASLNTVREASSSNYAWRDMIGCDVRMNLA